MKFVWFRELRRKMLKVMERDGIYGINGIFYVFGCWRGFRVV